MSIFNIRGREFHIRVQDVESMAADLQPQPLAKLTHVVRINGRAFPIRPLVAALTKLPVNEISSLDAYGILDRLGYLIQFCK